MLGLDHRAGGHRRRADRARRTRPACARWSSSAPCCRRRRCSPAAPATRSLVRISGFASDTDQRFARELDRQFAAARRPRGLIIDLRGNRGGLLRQAVAATDLLLDAGIDRHHRRPQPAGRARLAGRTAATSTKGKPVVVLVDGRSASAAEIMAGGDRRSRPRRRGRQLDARQGPGADDRPRCPTAASCSSPGAACWRPAGWPIQGLGVLPQICTSLGAEQLAPAARQPGEGHVSRWPSALARHRAARAPLPAAEIVAQRSACPAAEGRDADMATARFLLTHPNAYAAALLPPPPCRLDPAARMRILPA